MKPCVFFSVLLVSLFGSFAQEKPQSQKRTWGRSYSTESLGDKNPRLELGDVSQGLDHLMGGFDLIRSSKETVPQLVVKGHLNMSGEFVPHASLEVSDQEDGNWKIIESSSSDKMEVALTGAPHVDRLFVRIQLDAFQAYIGKFKYCRVVLQTGEGEVFPMVWLTEEGK